MIARTSILRLGHSRQGSDLVLIEEFSPLESTSSDWYCFYATHLFSVSGQLDRVMQRTGPHMNGHWDSAGHVFYNLGGAIG